MSLEKFAKNRKRLKAEIKQRESEIKEIDKEVEFIKKNGCDSSDFIFSFYLKKLSDMLPFLEKDYKKDDIIFKDCETGEFYFRIERKTGYLFNTYSGAPSGNIINDNLREIYLISRQK